MNKLRILDVPKKFQPKHFTINPPHQGKKPLIEERFYKFAVSNQINSDYIYLPIFWTQYHINNNYGKNLKDIKNFLNNLEEKYPSDKFFTIVQYDGGTLLPINNCTIFGSCGSFSSSIGKNSSYIPIPLLSERHTSFFYPKKKYLASFIGNSNTHKLRAEILDKYISDKDFLFNTQINFLKTFFFKYYTLSSYFALCPRGFGPSSFRLYEVLGLGQIPVYISDEFWLPYTNEINWNEIAILIKYKEINSLKEILNERLATDYLKMKNKIDSLKDKYFSWEGCIDYIRKKISNEI